jgi:hypothetical protein
MPTDERPERSVSKKVGLKDTYSKNRSKRKDCPLGKTKVSMCGGRCRDMKERDGG